MELRELEQQEDVAVDATSHIEQLTVELQSERFKKEYSEELLQAEKQKRKELARRLIVSEKKVTELQHQLTEPLTLPDPVMANELNEKEARLVELKKQLDSALQQTAPTNESEQSRIEELMKANETLKSEMTRSQQEIGEVLLLARQQADKMIADAEKMISAKIETSKQELLDIGNRSLTLSQKMTHNQEETTLLYKELQNRLSELTRLEYSM